MQKRLKLRCDRAIPCGSCVKRGCAAICPDGAWRHCPHFTLPSNHAENPQARCKLAKAIGNYRRHPVDDCYSSATSASRFVLASTQDLHEKISELSNRVRELEDGLRASHATHATDNHPLLTDELLRIKAPIQREGLGASSNGAAGEEGGDVVDTFGSLAISDTGRTSYFGQATSSFVCHLLHCSLHTSC